RGTAAATCPPKGSLSATLATTVRTNFRGPRRFAVRRCRFGWDGGEVWAVRVDTDRPRALISAARPAAGLRARDSAGARAAGRRHGLWWRAPGSRRPFIALGPQSQLMVAGGKRRPDRSCTSPGLVAARPRR